MYAYNLYLKKKMIQDNINAVIWKMTIIYRQECDNEWGKNDRFEKWERNLLNRYP